MYPRDFSIIHDYGQQVPLRAHGLRRCGLGGALAAGWEGARPLIWLFSLGCKPLGGEGVYESATLYFSFPFIHLFINY
eukprot:COSAG02_NODE_894_length_16133_cov_5.336036_11_plen_78_part_00